MTNKSIRDYINLIENAQQGSSDTVYPNAEVIKSKNGKPVGEIYQDASGWGCFHYGADNGADSISSREEAIEWLKDLHNEYRQDRSLREAGVADGSEQGPYKVMGGEDGYYIVGPGRKLNSGACYYDSQDAREACAKLNKKYVKQGSPDKQLDETTPDAMGKIDELFRDR